MLQFPPCSVAGEPLTGARAGPRLADSWAGPRLLGSRPGTRAGAARSQQFRMQFAYLNIQRSPQTLQFQRCEFKAHPNLGGIACEIKGAHQAESHAAPLEASTLAARQLPPTTTRTHDGITPTPESAVTYHQQQPEQTMATTGRALSAGSHPRHPHRGDLRHARPTEHTKGAGRTTQGPARPCRAHATPDTAATKRCGARQQAGPRTARLCVRTDARAHLRRWERRWRPPHRSTCP